MIGRMGAAASVVDVIAAGLRERIVAGALAPGERLREVQLAQDHGSGRHSVRAALRVLAAEGLVVLEPNRGARVARLEPDAVVALYELRTALEVEAAHLALHRHGGRLPRAVHAVADELAAACRAPEAGWPAVSRAHGAVHAAIVAAAGSPRIEATHAALAAETGLFLLQVRPFWSLDELAADHLALVGELERSGPDALRAHLRAAATAVVDGARDRGRAHA
jgi:DNA-binding GntR family transcriptional regulator